MIESYYTANDFTPRRPVTEIAERVRPRYFKVPNQPAAQAGGAR
jgi:hypothetical protein